MKEYDRLSLTNGNTIAMRGVVIIFFGLVAFTACQDNEHSKEVLSHEEMVKVLSELYITEEKINRLGLPHDSAAKVFDYFHSKTFDKLGTTDSTFKRSLNYYMERPEEIEKIYSVMIDSLNLREQRLSIPKTP